MPTIYGHDLDANTIALIRMNEQAAGDYTVNDFGANARHLTSEAGCSAIVPFSSGSTIKARRIQTTATKLACTNLGGDAAALIGNWTFKGWIYLDAAGSACFVICYAGNSEVTAQNHLASVRIETTGVPQIYWENGAGTDVLASCPVGTIPNATWTHFAAVKEDDELNSGKKKLTFYIAGVLKGVVRNLNNAAGGTSAQWEIGGDPAGNFSMIGNVRSLMFHTGLDSAATIAADAARTSGENAYTHLETGASVLAHYKCNETPDLSDEANNFHFRKATGAPPGTPSSGTNTPAEPLICTGQSRFFDASTEFQSSNYMNTLFLSALADEFTYESFVRLYNVTSNRGLFCAGHPGVETAADNYFAIDVTTEGKIQVDFEHGGGINASFTTASACFTTANMANRHHVAVTYSVVGSNAFVEVYFDGALVGTSGALAPFDTGTNDNLRIGIGNGNVAGLCFGVIDDMKLSNVKRTAAEILADATALECTQNGGQFNPAFGARRLSRYCLR